MNIAVLDFANARETESHLPPQIPSVAELMEQALSPHLLIGMPHMTPAGLSETWLMKELGHRHWLMLARHLGMPDADFRTSDGGEAYAAICATSLQDARFDKARANDVLTIRSALTPVSRTQVSTRHALSVRGIPIGDVELISTFVHRTRDGDNYSIARVPLPGMAEASAENALARTASLLRSGQLDTHLGLQTNPPKRLRGFRFEPDASQEFNGAGLFYFAQFQAIADRAFGRWFGTTRPIRHRDVFFSGNIRQGETVYLELMAMTPERGAALCRLLRQDGKVIGQIFSAWS